MNNVSKVYVGVDISKNHLDIALYPLRRFFRIKNSEEGMKDLLKELSQYDIANVGCEATGGYEKLLFRNLRDHSYNLWVIDPRRIKGFIVSKGCKSKTDKIDAQKIAEFTAKNTPDYEPIGKTEIEEKLLAIVNRKNDLIKMLVAEKTRLQHPSHAFQISNIKKFIKTLEIEVNKLNKLLQKNVLLDEKLQQKAQILTSIPGIGKASAAALLAFVPELGKISNNKIAALTGLCPYDNESGTYKGRKHIRGGRITPRNILYMCALTSIRYNAFKDFYDRLRAKEKPFKVAITAVMRKIIVLANSLLKKEQLFNI